MIAFLSSHYAPVCHFFCLCDLPRVVEQRFPKLCSLAICASKLISIACPSFGCNSCQYISAGIKYHILIASRTAEVASFIVDASYFRSSSYLLSTVVYPPPTITILHYVPVKRDTEWTSGPISVAAFIRPAFSSPGPLLSDHHCTQWALRTKINFHCGPTESAPISKGQCGRAAAGFKHICHINLNWSAVVSRRVVCTKRTRHVPSQNYLKKASALWNGQSVSRKYEEACGGGLPQSTKN